MFEICLFGHMVQLLKDKVIYGNPLQYSCLENPMDREAWQATVHEVARVRHDLATKPPPLPYSLASQVALAVKNPPAIEVDKREAGLILELGRSPGEGNGNTLQYFCLKNPMDRGAWRAAV